MKKTSRVSEYDPVSLRPSWGSVSITFFVCSLFSLPLMRRIPISLDEKWAPLAIVLGAPGLAALGLLFGLLGWFRSAVPSSARLGVFLNGVALVCVIVGLAVVAAIRRG